MHGKQGDRILPGECPSLDTSYAEPSKNRETTGRTVHTDEWTKNMARSLEDSAHLKIALFVHSV
jgi:hypothetical protein